MNVNSPLRCGIDLGGTKIELQAFDPAGHSVWRARRATPQGDYPATLAAITTLVGEAEAALQRPLSVGIGTPGALSLANGRIKNANSTCLNGQPLQQDLERQLQRPVRLANDANCFALSEATDGAAAGAASVFGVILGTGVGGGLVVNGALLPGCNHIAGEWGHNPLPLPEADELPLPACYCGRAGCVETFLSGPGWQAWHARHYGSVLTPHQIVAAARGGEAQAVESLQRYAQRLARALAGVINLFDPAVIVLGGGLSQIDELYTLVPACWDKWIFSDTITTRLVAPRYGDASGVRGAAWLWPGAV